MSPDCGACTTPVRALADHDGAVAYCDRCHVAYLEFKLRLLILAYRELEKKSDEV